MKKNDLLRDAEHGRILKALIKEGKSFYDLNEIVEAMDEEEIEKRPQARGEVETR